MPTQYSPLLGLALPVTGELSGTWGDTVNNYITTYLDSSVAGTQTISADTNTTLTVTNGSALGSTSAQYMLLNCTGARTAARTITLPASSRRYIVINATTGGFAVNIVGAGPTTGISVANGERCVIVWNGSDYVKVSSTVALPAGSTTQVQYNNAGALAGSSNLTFDGTTLVAANFTDSSLTSGRVTYAGTGGNLTDNANFVFDGSNLGVGTSSPSGNGRLELNVPSGNNTNLTFYENGASRWLIGSVTGSNAFRFYDLANATERFQIAATGAWGLSGANYGTSGQVLTSNGSGSAPTWQTVGGGSAATPTSLGTVYGGTTSSASLLTTYLGYQAGNSVGGGTFPADTFIGYQSGFSTTTGFQNTAVGASSLYSNVSGTTNAAFGSNALYYNTASANTAVGSNALFNNTSGTLNAALGQAALFSNTTASNNTAVGYRTAYSNTTGTDITAVGANALNFNTTGSYNTAFGRSALGSNTTASYNTAVGWLAGYSNTTGARNAFVGIYAGYFNSTGTDNSFFGGMDTPGYGAGHSNTTGSQNTALGTAALSRNTTGSGDVAIGYQALYSANPSVSGYSGYNVAIGYQALYSAGTVASNSTGVCTAVGYLAGYNTNAAGNSAQDTFIGSQSGYNNTSGYGNTFVGALSGYGQTTGDQNTCIGGLTGRYSTGSGGNKLVAVGYTAGYSNTGNDNTFVGTGAGSANTSAIDNAFFGTYSGISNTTGSQNAAFGKDSLRSNTTASFNTTIGYFSGYSLTTGDRNTFLGASAGSGGLGASAFTTGQYNISIGFTTGASSGARNNSIVIGTPYAVVDKGENTGFINPNSGGVYQGNNSSSWSTTSDFRLKKNIVDNNEGLEKIAAIRVRNFEYRTAEEVTELPAHTVINKTGVQLGVIAQELQQVCPDCVKEESTGVLSVDSDNVFWHMVNAIKQLKAEVDSLKAQINQGA